MAAAGGASEVVSIWPREALSVVKMAIMRLSGGICASVYRRAWLDPFGDRGSSNMGRMTSVFQ